MREKIQSLVTEVFKNVNEKSVPICVFLDKTLSKITMCRCNTSKSERLIKSSANLFIGTYSYHPQLRDYLSDDFECALAA